MITSFNKSNKMEGKTVVLSVLILSLVLAQLQVDAKSCCPNTTARNIYNTCRLAGGSQSACASVSGCIHQTSSICRPPFPSEALESSTALESSEGCQNIPFLLCDLVCDKCVCTRAHPLIATCICAQWKPFGELQKSEKVSTELEVVNKSVGGFIPYPQCIQECDECVICTKNLPVEKQLCYCGKKIVSNSQKPAIEFAEKLLKELDVVAKPVTKTVGGFIPYLECIEKCDECVICTLPYPIERALCYCGKKTETERKALPI